MVKFKEDHQQHIESDIGKIQTSTGMYIGYKGRRAALHLCKEILNNNIDELTNENTVGNAIECILDTTKNLFIARDNGRGIPFEHLEKNCTKLQAGSKLNRSGSAGSGAGQNGVGLTACNALSDSFEISSTRYGEKKALWFEQGEKKSDKIVKAKSSEHGTSVSIIPSPYYLSSHGEDCIIEHEQLIKWIDTISHTIPPNITIKTQVILDKEKTINKKFVNKDGMYGYLKKTIDKPLLEPFVIKDLFKFKEFDRELQEEVDKYVGLEAAITFVSDSDDKLVDSFCNFVHTFDGGNHADSVLNSCVSYFMKQAKEKMSDRDLKNYEPKRVDILNSLAIRVNVQTNTHPDFSGQVKEKVTSKIFTQVFSEMGMVRRNLIEYFKENPKQLDKIVEIIKTNAKARVKSTEVKNTEYKKSKTINHDLRKAKRFIKGDVENKNLYSELLVVEGDSASGGIEAKRFPFQDAAILRGVPINVLNNKKVRVLENAEIKLIVQAMRANQGKDFDIDDAFYDKVIIMSDGDSDGNLIFSSMVLFFMVYMRPLVEAGRVYRVLPPLYKIKDSKNPFIKNKAEYFEVYVQRIQRNIMIEADGKVMSAKDLKDFFYSNRDYLEELQDLAKYFGVHPFIAEFICKHWGNKNFEKMLKERFPEMNVDGDTVEGVFEGKYQYIIVNKRFHKNAKLFIDILTNPSNTSDLYEVKKTTTTVAESLGLMSIGELLTECQQYAPKIMQRYKGLGEITHTEFRETVLDPNNRQLIRLTVADFEKAMEQMKVLHDDSPRSSKARKELISTYTIRKDELDN